MPAPLLLIPAAIIAALKIYIIKHAAHITIAACSAAAVAYIRSRDANDARNAAIGAGANAATGDLVLDFFR